MTTNLDTVNDSNSPGIINSGDIPRMTPPFRINRLLCVRLILVIPTEMVRSPSAKLATRVGLILTRITHLRDIDELDFIDRLGRTDGPAAVMVDGVIGRAGTAVLGHTVAYQPIQVIKYNERSENSL